MLTQTFARLQMLIPLAAAALLLPACASHDKSTYVSTVYSPKTITVTDTMSKREMWQMPVPVGQSLTLNYDHPDDVNYIKTAKKIPTSMTWILKDTESGDELDKGKLNLPAGMVPQTKVAIRPAPEYPEGFDPNTTTVTELESKNSYVITPAPPVVPTKPTAVPETETETTPAPETPGADIAPPTEIPTK